MELLIKHQKTSLISTSSKILKLNLTTTSKTKPNTNNFKKSRVFKNKKYLEKRMKKKTISVKHSLTTQTVVGRYNAKYKSNIDKLVLRVF